MPQNLVGVEVNAECKSQVLQLLLLQGATFTITQLRSDWLKSSLTSIMCILFLYLDHHTFYLSW